MKRTPLSKKSKVPISKLKRKLLEEVKKVVRESGPCMHGTDTACGGGMQGSHVLAEGAYPQLKFDPRNIMPQCWKHHFFWWHRSPLDAAEWFQTNFPERWEYLMSVKKTHLDLTPDRIQMLRTATKKGLSEYMDCYEDFRQLP